MSTTTPVAARDEMRVAVIGLGAMGLPMALHLAGEFTVTAFDPAAERLDTATGLGIRPAASPAAAAAEAEIVLLAVRDQAQLEEALFGIDGKSRADGVAEALPAGGVVIITSTIGAEPVRAMARRLGERGLLVVDAPISGGPVRAGMGDLLIVVGAAADALSVARPVLDRLASTLTIVGSRVGDGQILKTINQLLAGVHIAAAAEAIALARGLGVDPEVVVSALANGAAGSFMFSDRGPRMVEAYRGHSEVKSRLDIFVKDMAIVADAAAAAHVPTPLAAAAQQLYLIAERQGLGAEDDSRLVTVLSPA